MTLIQFAGLTAVVCSALVITSRNPVFSVLFLIGAFLSMALWLVLHGTTYLGLAYIIIYVGAIAILFLFVIMMLNIQVSDLVYTSTELAQNLPLGSLLILLFALVIGAEMLSWNPSSLTAGYGVQGIMSSDSALPLDPRGLVHDLSAFNQMSCPSADLALSNFMQIESIGMGLYTSLIVWLVGVSFILMLAMVGPILLCMNDDDTYDTRHESP